MVPPAIPPAPPHQGPLWLNVAGYCVPIFRGGEDTTKDPLLLPLSCRRPSALGPETQPSGLPTCPCGTSLDPAPCLRPASSWQPEAWGLHPSGSAAFEHTFEGRWAALWGHRWTPVWVW